MRDEKNFPNTKEWSEEQRERFYKENLPFIRNFTKSYLDKYQCIYDRAVEDSDLMQEASLGFYKAYDSYNPSKNTKFTTYASKIMRNQLNMTIRSILAEKRMPLYPTIPFNTYVNEFGEEVVGGENLDLSDYSLTNQSPSIEKLYARKEVVEFVYKTLERNFTRDEKDIFLSLSQKLKTQKELAAEQGCSQAKISMTYKFILISLNYELKKADFTDDDLF